MKLIDDKALLKLNIHILTMRYMEKEAFCFTKITENNEKINEDGKKAETVSNSEMKTKNKRLYVKKKKRHGLYHL